MDWTLILGNRWLRHTRSSLNFDDLTIRGYTRKSKPFVLRCTLLDKPLTGSGCIDPKLLVISAVQAKRLLRSWCKSFLSTVTKVSDAVSAMPDTSLVQDILEEYADVFCITDAKMDPARESHLRIYEKILDKETGKKWYLCVLNTALELKQRRAEDKHNKNKAH